MRLLGVACFLLLQSACVPRSCARDATPGSGFDCCEGDVLLLLDSSGSVSFYEFSHMLHFLSNLLSPFQVGRGHVRVALVQVDTEPHVEFNFSAHNSQNTLQDALLRTPQLRGDTKTETALLMAQSLLWRPEGQEAPPRVLLWLTDGVEPGNVNSPIAELHEEGVSVLAVSTGHSNYQVFRRAVTPPIDKHLYFVDPDYMDIITKDLREAITELICTECLHVRNVTSQSAMLHWQPILIHGLGQYELQYGETGRSIETYRKLTLSPDHTWIELTDLQPETHYSVRLTAHTPYSTHSRTLSASFTTLPELICTKCLHVRDVTSQSAMLHWQPILIRGLGHYELQYGETGRSIETYRKLTLSPDHIWIELTDLQPETHYSVRLTAHTPYSTHSRTLSASFTTLPEVLHPTTVVVSESGPDWLRVSWSPVQSGRVEWYRVEFGPIPRGDVRSVMLSRSESSVLLTQLQTDTHYLITISAVYSSSQEGAISVKACTQEVLPAVHDLQLTPMGFDSVKVDWMSRGQGAGLQGYWVKWETGEHSSSLSSSSRYVPAHLLSTVLTHLNPTTRVCVSPVYRTARGEGLCCTTHTALS
ncbi:von Willebrand factor A domain-containing protein 1-like isoform X2 [Neoarius graeffei]|uniref:von Willebrand factor A domain-containing protein 1-like isoform X2 n=1 Tax=Neoarius graeffei TaxID=443677 RepID=UPI00298C0DAC|nr:von Willebrand factor A domain-containing protein 1-like isoform X2 [Neoarius graeffei]